MSDERGVIVDVVGQVLGFGTVEAQTYTITLCLDSEEEFLRLSIASESKALSSSKSRSAMSS